MTSTDEKRITTIFKALCDENRVKILKIFRGILEEVGVGFFRIMKFIVLAFVWVIVIGCLLTTGKK